MPNRTGAASAKSGKSRKDTPAGAAGSSTAATAAAAAGSGSRASAGTSASVPGRSRAATRPRASGSTSSGQVTSGSTRGASQDRTPEAGQGASGQGDASQEARVGTASQSGPPPATATTTVTPGGSSTGASTRRKTSKSRTGSTDGASGTQSTSADVATASTAAAPTTTTTTSAAAVSGTAAASPREPLPPSTRSPGHAASDSDAARAARPHSGAPPTYEESVNHLTLEYGGYFVPYESRPIATPLASVPSLSFSQSQLAGRTGHRGSRNSVAPLSLDRVPLEHGSRGRNSRRVGDLALTASERVVITQRGARELEEAEEEEGGSDKCTKLLLPPMHICMATTCLVCNCVIPGSGTLVAAFGLFCCTNPEEWSCGKKLASCCLCLLVAIAQLILTPVLLIGWIWSILWGFAYVGVSHQEYHGIKDDEDEEDELATIASVRGRRHLSDISDEDAPPWALGYHRFDHPGSAPSHRRMSFVGTGSQVDLDRRHASMLRATRSYGYVEVQGLHGGLYGGPDYHRQARTRQQRPLGSAGSSSTLNNNRPMSQTTLTSYINDGMFLNNPPPPQPRSTHPPSMVTVDM